jgi:Holliday junction resolvase RusA-like endonuclease
VVTLIIPGTLPNLNDYQKVCRANKYVGAKMKREVEEMICWEIKSQIKEKFSSVTLIFRWHEPNKRRDPDNISSFGRKVCLDALQATGVLTGDGWKQIVGFSDEFYVDAKNPRVEVVIQEAKNPF